MLILNVFASASAIGTAYLVALVVVLHKTQFLESSSALHRSLSNLCTVLVPFTACVCVLDVVCTIGAIAAALQHFLAPFGGERALESLGLRASEPGYQILRSAMRTAVPSTRVTRRETRPMTRPSARRSRRNSPSRR